MDSATARDEAGASNYGAMLALRPKFSATPSHVLAGSGTETSIEEVPRVAIGRTAFRGGQRNSASPILFRALFERTEKRVCSESFYDVVDVDERPFEGRLFKAGTRQFTSMNLSHP